MCFWRGPLKLRLYDKTREEHGLEIESDERVEEMTIVRVLSNM